MGSAAISQPTAKPPQVQRRPGRFARSFGCGSTRTGLPRRGSCDSLSSAHEHRGEVR